MYDTIYELTNQLKLKNMIIEYMVPLMSTANTRRLQSGMKTSTTGLSRIQATTRTSKQARSGHSQRSE